jgi:competence ComEA-like helix-hairpin-helix protein
MTGGPGTFRSVRPTRGNQAALVVLCAAAGAWMLSSAAGPVRKLPAVVPVDAARVRLASERIDPNTASAASLRRLPGVGPTIAERIVEYRGAHGGAPFRRPEDLQAVSRIGPATVDEISPLLDLPAWASSAERPRSRPHGS